MRKLYDVEALIYVFNNLIARTVNDSYIKLKYGIYFIYF